MIFHVNDVKKTIPDTVTIVAATKYFDVAQMRTVFEEGIHHFGENRDDAFLAKYNALTDLPITWHYIGTLQTKKVKKVINKIDFLHSLDRIKLAEEINKRRIAPLKCFLQVNISDEESKHGLEFDDVLPFLEAIKDYKNVVIIGFMGMAEFSDDFEKIGSQFERLVELKSIVNNQTNLTVTELSIGMSNDYHIALKHDATYLRLGSVLFSKEV